MLYKYGHSEKNAMLNTLIFLLTKVRNIFYTCNSWQEIYLGDKYLFVFRRSTPCLYKCKCIAESFRRDESRLYIGSFF